MPNDEKIESFDQLKTEYQKARVEAEKHIRDDMKKFVEITKALPEITAEAVARGIKNKIADIDQGFENINLAEIENEISIGTLAGAKTVTNQKWAKDNSDRSKIVTGTVTNTKNKINDMKAQMAKGAIKVTSVVGKGLVLFGQKGLAKSMQEKVAKKGEAFVSKDSRIGTVMERVADGGFYVADGVRGAAETVKGGVESAAKTVGNGVKSAAKTVSTKARNAKTAVENEIDNRKQAFRDAGTRADLDQMSIARERADKNRENDSWQQVYDGRSKIVTDKVKEVNDRSVNRKSKAALRDIKITGVLARGVALFGPKGLAEKMQNEVYKNASKRIARDSISSKIAKTAAEKGFKVSSKFKKMVKDTKDTAVELKDAAILTAEEKVQQGKQAIENGKTAVKKGALEFGKKTYKGAATIGALASIGLGAVKTGVNDVADKVEEGVDFVSGKVGKYKDDAKDKIKNTKSYQSFAKFTVNMAKSVIEKIGPTIKGKEPEQEVEQKVESKNIENKKEESFEIG